MRLCASFLLALLCGLVLGGPARAAIVFTFDQANYDVAAGGTVNVSISLEETGTTILRDEGLFSAAVKVSWNNPPAPSDPARVLNDADIVINPGFTDPFFSFTQRTTTYAALVGNVFVPDDPFLYPSEANEPFRILLGTFTFTAGDVAGEVTHLTATDFALDFDETVTGSFTVLDGELLAGLATISVLGAPPPNTVPEPSSLTLATFGLACMAAFCRRGKRHPQWFGALSRNPSPKSSPR